jgi:WD40 repeat protein
MIWFHALFSLCSSLSGVAKIWRVPQVTKFSTLKGDTECATDVAFSLVHNHLATASADQTARLWNTDGSLLKKFEGHLDRLAQIGFHPSGKYLGTASFDKTWRLRYRFWCGAASSRRSQSESLWNSFRPWWIISSILWIGLHVFGTYVPGEVQWHWKAMSSRLETLSESSFFSWESCFCLLGKYSC